MAVLDHTLVTNPQRPAADRTSVQRLPMARETEGIPQSPLVPGEIQLGTLSDPRLRVESPLLVRLAFDHDQVVAEVTELNEFGFGANLSEAVADVQSAIVQLYFSLEKDAGRLGPDLQRTWEALKTFVVKAETPSDQARPV